MSIPLRLVAGYVGALLLASAITTTQAGQLSGGAGQSTVYAPGIDGIEFELDPQTGTIRRLYSRHVQAVLVGDRVGINKAYVMAEEKAKAAIVRFMGQTSTSVRKTTEILADVQNLSSNAGPAGGGLSSSVQRKFDENLHELTGSFAAGRLVGVTVLGRGYDERRAEVWVEVGISEKSIAVANGIGMMMDGPRPYRGDGMTRSDGTGSGLLQGSEERRVRPDRDW